MGGSITVTSRQGVGSTFRFTARVGRQADNAQHIGDASSLTDHTCVLFLEGKDNIGAELHCPLLRETVRFEPVGKAGEVLDIPPGAASLGDDGNAAIAVAARPRELMPATDPSTAQLPATGLRDGHRAMVVEDNAINLIVAVGLLESLGWSVETAGDGLEALAAHALRDFDVIFMDCQMPKMDGFAATAEIRKREAATATRTPIIALTASAEGSFLERCLDSGMDDYLKKPFSRLQMQTALAKMAKEACPT